MSPAEIFKQLSSMQARMSELKGEIATHEFVGESGGGLVHVVMNGESEVKKVSIDPSLTSEDLSVIEELVASAFNAAVQSVHKEHVGKMTEAFGLEHLMGALKS